MKRLFFLPLLIVIIGCFLKPTPKPEFTPIPSGPAPTPFNITISVDLCQSHKPYEKRLFVYLDNLAEKLGKPVPIAICVAGGWLQKHQQELKEIKAYKNLDITWVNHSLTHPVDNDFLNNPKVAFKKEVYGNFALMKKYGLKPSKYFRFPGLRHNKARLALLKKMGYTSLDASAWLAKGEPIKDGCVILVHGNGNEPKGIGILLDYLNKNESGILHGKIKIIPIQG